jgi:hypothetical protein
VKATLAAKDLAQVRRAYGNRLAKLKSGSTGTVDAARAPGPNRP